MFVVIPRKSRAHVQMLYGGGGIQSDPIQNNLRLLHTVSLVCM